MKMKTVRLGVVIALLFGVFFNDVDAQLSGRLPVFNEIPTLDLAVGYSKTTNLVFPYEIKSVDRGSKSLLAQKAKGVENVLLVKAGQVDFAETNLSVITGDGRLYSFRVVYAENPSLLNLSFQPDSVPAFAAWPERVPAKIDGVLVNDDILHADADHAKHAATFLNKRTKENKVAAALHSIYVKDKVMWFSLELQNYSLLDYEPAFIRFFLKDKKKAKRTAQQETELYPVYQEKSLSVAGNKSLTTTIGLPQFTIPADQQLVIQIGEHNNSRLLELTIKGGVILKTRLLRP
ncbi:conjugative transposon protein TraN [Filimonas effusa]|uniref:Conjugative transposon protein TraN n=1 Tax=Filimonas effusa TaxID=2508721 RepID=A0A4Q1D265_9BACT|nr:conjugative transposon protein TraN [Filimonas effusa]RXK81297.1 conjugative transposon protein TraN [Filimonas effusa]